jgi:hypothetical protein
MDSYPASGRQSFSGQPVYAVQGMLMGSFRRILLHVLPCRITPELSNTEFPDSKIEVVA